MSLDPDEATLENIRKARVYKGIPPDQYLVPFRNFGEMLDKRAAETPEKVYLIHYDGEGNREEFTYAEINARVNQVANYLAKALGVKRGDRVGTIAHNHSDMVILYFACWKLGAAVAPQNVAEDNNRIGYILRNSEAVVAFVRPEYMERAETIIHGAEPIGNVREIIQTGGTPDGKHRHLQSELGDQPTAFGPAGAVSPEEEALLVYTSGTTG